MKPAFCKDILDQVPKIAQKMQGPRKALKFWQIFWMRPVQRLVSNCHWNTLALLLHSTRCCPSLHLSSAALSLVESTPQDITQTEQCFTCGPIHKFIVQCSCSHVYLLYHIWHCTPINYYQGPSTSFALHLSGFCHKAFQRHVCSTLMGASIRTK